jgi:ABC-type glycerol-3-phosphate transport system substrate-binding protein
MRTRLRTCVGLIAAITVSGVLAACGSSASSGGSSNATVTWWSPNWDTPVAKQLVTDFQQKNPGITVKMVETTSATMANKISVALNSGTTPDVITELASRTQQYAAKGQLTDLSSLFDSSMPTSDFLPGTMQDVSTGGKEYAVPYRWDNVSLIYNKDLFSAAGITSAPTTIAELEADAKKLTQGDTTGIGWPMGNNDNTVLRFFGLAASTTSAPATNVKGVAHLTQASTTQALDIISGSIKDGWASKSSLEVDSTGLRQLFENKQVAMYLGGVYDLIELQSKGLNVGTALMPGFGGPSLTAANGWTFLIPKASKNVTAAEKFVQYLSTPATMATLTLTFPARISAGSDPKFHTALATPFYDQLQKYAVAAPYDPSWGVLEPTLFSEIQAVALGKASSADAAKVIQDAATTANAGK